MTRDNKLFKDQYSNMTFLSGDKNVQSSVDSKQVEQGDELGPNTEIGSKLRALYSSIQDETIPDRFLDLLEKLDRVEHNSSADTRY